MKSNIWVVWGSGICTVYMFMAVSAAGADEQADVKNFLHLFHADAKAVMIQLPQQVVDGNAVGRGNIDYSKPRRISYKKQVQDLIQSHSKMNLQLSIPLGNDLASEIIDGEFVVKDISELDKKRWVSGGTKIIPWADSYWPDYLGSIGVRYADPNFPNTRNFIDNRDYILKKNADKVIESQDQNAIDFLSPAEKYDLLVGDKGWTLTQYAWSQGQKYIDSGAGVPSWTGICHGWAAAASQNVRVAHTPIAVQSIDRLKIIFYPSDVKALQSMLWANAAPSARFVGGRCNSVDPIRDSVGRITDPDCLDNNPATFHLILANQLGGNQRSFVMDSIFDAEVWNFPLSSFAYKYFNPQTKAPTPDFRNAIVPMEEFTIDKFSAYRSPAAKYVIGIVMDDTYVIEISPTRESQEISPQATYRYYYDLELNQNFEVIGGEWYSNAHPDFIWTFAATAQARSFADSSIDPEDWREAYPPETWTKFARQASKRGQPLLAVINGLLSRQKP